MVEDMASVSFGKKQNTRWLEGTVVAYIRSDYLGKKRLSMNQVIGSVKKVLQIDFKPAEVLSVLEDVEDNPDILPTIPPHVKQRKIEKIKEQLETLLSP